MAATLIVLVIAGWPGSRTVGTWWAGLIAAGLAAGGILLSDRQWNPVRSSSRVIDLAATISRPVPSGLKRFFEFEWLNTFLGWAYRLLAVLISRDYFPPGRGCRRPVGFRIIDSFHHSAQFRFTTLIPPEIIIGLLIATSSGLLISRDWRWIIGVLAVQYIGVFLLISLDWPFSMALIKLVTGWMSGAALGLTQLGRPAATHLEKAWPSSRVFRLLAAALILLVVFSTANSLAAWLPGVSRQEAIGGLILAGTGLLQIGMSGSPFRVVIGLLTIMAGFEILYAAVETSVLVTGLLAGVTLGLALTGAYLISISEPQEAG